MVSGEGLQDIFFGSLLARYKATYAILGIDVFFGIFPKLFELCGIPLRAPVLQLDLREGIAVKIKQGFQEMPLGDALNFNCDSTSEVFAFHDSDLGAQEEFLHIFLRLAPGHSKWGPQLLNRRCLP